MSRLIPGVRALVPPFAGALHIPPLQAIGSMAIASAVWYGIISYVAFNADAEWTELMRVIKESGMWIAVAAAVLLAFGIGVWLVRRRRTQTS